MKRGRPPIRQASRGGYDVSSVCSAAFSFPSQISVRKTAGGGEPAADLPELASGSLTYPPSLQEGGVLTSFLSLILSLIPHSIIEKYLNLRSFSLPK